MRLKIKEIDIIAINESEAFDLRKELIELKVANDGAFTEKNPALYKLYRLLTGAFESSHEGVHFLRDREFNK